MECLLCLGKCIIAIQPKCFPCYRVKENHCFSFQRFCLECFLLYIRNKRSCPYCHECIKNTPNEWYNMIIEENMSCPICKKEDITNEHFTECFMICDCGEMIKKGEEKNHSITCEKIELCVLCGTFVIETKKKSHMLYHKETDEMKCPLCNEKVTIYDFMQCHWIPHIEYYQKRQKEVEKILQENTLFLSNLNALTIEMYNKIYKDNLFE